ncbi:hypothetical protein E2C01_068341 [Portunus trituberculatus]|uniref:Uncharacterized protein n=1 Tax=Portunus trituberculatus TaxID=210409 RepID=A0A5B7HXL8_PORTR|nr:hypothetical protein [Portunus trituberculatus]
MCQLYLPFLLFSVRFELQPLWNSEKVFTIDRSHCVPSFSSQPELSRVFQRSGVRPLLLRGSSGKTQYKFKTI